ncbi:MAG TPA: hypothetical protein PLO65_07685 [Caulobacter sp.]|nr:hypothetical protein [Caulobacter sp.]
METLPFDPAEYLDSEEAIAAYLADAQQDGPAAVSRAAVVVARARQVIEAERLRRGVGETAAPPFKSGE